MIGLFYSPGTADAVFFNNFNANIDKVYEISRNLILVGDLNEDLLIMNCRTLRDILLINSMQNVINDATRQNAILDPIIIFDDMSYTDCGVTDTPAHISDHKATYLIIPFHYAKQWLINFNPFKTEAMLFTLKQLEQFPNLIFNNTLIQFVKDHKHLRLMSSNNGQWHKHIENLLTNEEIKVYFNKGRPKPEILFFLFYQYLNILQ